MRCMICRRDDDVVTDAPGTKQRSSTVFVPLRPSAFAAGTLRSNGCTGSDVSTTSRATWR